ncbi:hypothetical protein VNO78_12980 [Psophocarpus tetragonolobus]|uniref:Ubiquitin-activating enzyme E1 four-helix bundle domain-containing protein n=1 Tax=Psophocarpus tetragonolobus TaxID=3891 RepID=A0AAN9XPR3_PSOTE
MELDRSPLPHIAFQGLNKFISELRCFPVAGSEDDAHKLISAASTINDSLGQYGGIVGLEVVKACSGKFHPLFFRKVFGYRNYKVDTFFYFDSGITAFRTSEPKSCKINEWSRNIGQPSSSSSCDRNIGQSKSTVAASAVTCINTSFNIEAEQNLADTENVFNDTFWEL